MTRRAARVLALVLASAAATVRAQHAGAPTAAEVEAGRKLYVSSCQRCHGIALVTAGIGFDLRTFPQHDKARFVRSVSQGVGAMPAWGETLNPEQLDLLWGYIGAVNGWRDSPPR
jgi:mono/diheme cytochrome c family protein